ncbi:MAG TPA: YggS family pyridoxal phosphate-dependent enzyme [Xanthomonadales bacterium]|nr:YggS family pyridoxal phosphate-dependent enzyme [Xanthomonadales bacterium]
MNNLKENLDNVSSRVKSACEDAGREFSEVRILAVSKRHPACRVEALHKYGQTAFGENVVAEALGKISALSRLELEWHFIGQVQSNKTRDIANSFSWVQSVDRARILRRLSDQRPVQMPSINVCLQVNIDNEPQKAGCSEAEVVELAELARDLPGIRLRGLMAIPGIDEATGCTAKQSFVRMKSLFQDCLTRGFEMDTLSMGMSADLEQAISAGSTMVRIGTDIFGPRP